MEDQIILNIARTKEDVFDNPCPGNCRSRPAARTHLHVLCEPHAAVNRALQEITEGGSLPACQRLDQCLWLEFVTGESECAVLREERSRRRAGGGKLGIGEGAGMSVERMGAFVGIILEVLVPDCPTRARADSL